MSFLDDLFETAGNIFSSTVNIAAAVSDGLKNCSENMLRDNILKYARLLKESDESLQGSTAPNWFYVEKAKETFLENYVIPYDKRSSYEFYSSRFCKSSLIKLK